MHHSSRRRLAVLVSIRPFSRAPADSDRARDGGEAPPIRRGPNSGVRPSNGPRAILATLRPPVPVRPRRACPTQCRSGWVRSPGCHVGLLAQGQLKVLKQGAEKDLRRFQTHWRITYRQDFPNFTCTSGKTFTTRATSAAASAAAAFQRRCWTQMHARRGAAGKTDRA